MSMIVRESWWRVSSAMRNGGAFALVLASLVACSSSDGANGAATGGNTAGGSSSSAGAHAGGQGASGGQSSGGSGGGSGAVGMAGAGAGASGAGGVNSAGTGGTNAGGANGGGTNAAGAGGANGAVGPRFIGRFDTTKPAAPVFEWSGAAISLRFKGTSIGVTLTDGTSNAFEVIVDGKHSVVPTTGGTQKYQLATGLTDGPHDLLLYRRTEALDGDTTFGGFDVDPSAYLAGDAPPPHRLEVIGDSISAGYGDEGTYPCAAGPANENHYLTYEALAARAVNAELYTEAWSGIGMYRNIRDSGDTMPAIYGRTVPTKDTKDTWDFSKFVPDAVVINLGTNDFNAGDPGMPFQTTYTTFVTRLRGYYPKARFYLAVGPMLSGNLYTQAKTYLNGVISARAAARDTNLALLEFGTQDQADGLGCDYHPSLKTHQKMADKLVAALKADLGF